MKWGKTMQYETPELTPLTPGIDAIQGGCCPHKGLGPGIESVASTHSESISGYEDWEK